jgi:cell division protein FtsB
MLSQEVRLSSRKHAPSCAEARDQESLPYENCIMQEFAEIFFTYLRLTLPLLTLGTGAYFVRRFIRAIEHRTEVNAEVAALRDRVTQLEETSDTTEREIMRLQAAQEFATRLLAERSRE